MFATPARQCAMSSGVIPGSRLEMRLGVLIHFQAPALKGPSTMASKLLPRFLGRRLMEIPNNSELMLFHGLMPSANHSL